MVHWATRPIVWCKCNHWRHKIVAQRFAQYNIPTGYQSRQLSFFSFYCVGVTEITYQSYVHFGVTQQTRINVHNRGQSPRSVMVSHR